MRATLATLQQRFTAWALRRQRLDHGTVTLTQHSIYIIPTRQGLAFSGVLLLTLLGDINYILSLGYVLTFLLGAMAVMSMVHTIRNLVRLEIRAGRVAPVFCGEGAEFLFHFHNPAELARYGLHLRDEHGHRTSFDMPPQQSMEVRLQVPAARRGWLAPGRVTLYSTYPLGLFYAWSYVDFDIRALVYPRPAATAQLPSSAAPSGTGMASVAGDEDFSGLRNYTAGDTMQRIAWKALAREQGLQVKQFSALEGAVLWLDWQFAPSNDPEQRLSIITRWILDAEAQGLVYGLRLPGDELAPDRGAAHRDECLRAVALFGLPTP